MAGRAAIFIDGGYLDSVLRDEFSGVRINYQALSEELSGNSEILRTYYYHCPMIQGPHPTKEQSRRYAQQQRFFRSLEALPRYTIRLGRLARRGTRADGSPRYVQKRVDILLGVDMVQLATKNRIQDVILVAGDSDFIPAVTAAKSEGVLVRVFHGAAVAADLWREADERTRITDELIQAVLR